MQIRPSHHGYFFPQPSSPGAKFVGLGPGAAEQGAQTPKIVGTFIILHKFYNNNLV